MRPHFHRPAAPHRTAVVGHKSRGRSRGRGARLSLRARVFVRRGTLDALLAAGADPSWDPELELRAAQIGSLRTRRAVAHGLERAVLEAHRPARWSCAVPLDRRAVRAAAAELSALAVDLAVEAAPAAQGVALATQLLRDPASPLYMPGGGEALRRGAVIARRALG
jgi:hypothetical protein